MKKESYTTIPAEKELYITLTMKDALPATVAMHNHIKKHCRAMAKDLRTLIAALRRSPSPHFGHRRIFTNIILQNISDLYFHTKEVEEYDAAFVERFFQEMYGLLDSHELREALSHT